MIRLSRLACYRGPSRWADEPVVTAGLVLSESAAFLAAAARLTEICGPWFIAPQRLSEDPTVAAGQFLACWARDLLNKQDGRITEAGATRQGEEVVVHLGYHQPQASWQALELGVRLLTEPLDDAAIGAALAEFWKQTRWGQPDFQAAILIEYARRHDLPWRRVNRPGRLWHFGWGARGAVMFESEPMSSSRIGSVWARDKATSKQVFVEVGAPVAASMVVRGEQDLARAADHVGFPCVVKPLDGSRSVGVSTGVADPGELGAAFALAARHTSSGVIVEKQVHGELVRLVVMRGRFWRAIRRNRPARVADGTSTAAELLIAYNDADAPKRVGRPYMGPAPDDEQFRTALRQQGLTPADVPAAGRLVRLRNIPLAAEGARYDDVTEYLHPDTRDMAEALARYFAIPACGLDFITADPAQSCHRQGAFIEINAVPGLRVPMMAGVPEDEVCRGVLGDEIGRVPSLLVVAHPASRDELLRGLPEDNSLGWAAGDRAGMGATVLSGRRRGIHGSVDVILRHPNTQAMVVIASAEDITGAGLPADRFDKAVVFADSGLPDVWKDVVRRRCGGYAETGDPAAAASAVAALDRARPIRQW